MTEPVVTSTVLPPALAELAEEFTAAPVQDRLQLLLELGDELPALPDRYAGHAEAMERVPECQSPLFLATEVHEGAARLFFSAPPEAPTTRGFAGILHAGLDGLPVPEVLAVPDDAPLRFGLAEAVSPLRLRGMVAMLSRLKRQLRAAAPAQQPTS